MAYWTPARLAAETPVSVAWSICAPLIECALNCLPVSAFGLIRFAVTVFGLIRLPGSEFGLTCPEPEPYVTGQPLAISRRISLPFSLVPSRNSTVRPASLEATSTKEKRCRTRIS